MDEEGQKTTDAAEERPEGAEAQTPPNQPETTKVAPAPRDWGKISIVAGFTLLVVLLIWQTAALSLQKRSAAEELAKVKKSASETLSKAESERVVALDEAARDGGKQAAVSLAAGVHQLFLLRSQYPDVTDRTFQAVCAQLAATGEYDLAVITDSQGKVLASSDLTQVGQTFPEPVGSEPSAAKKGGKWQAAAPVKSDAAVLGGVVLLLR